MEIGLIGLGRMGGGIVQRLLGGGHSVVAYDPRPEAVEALAQQGAVGASSIEDAAKSQARPGNIPAWRSKARRTARGMHGA